MTMKCSFTYAAAANTGQRRLIQFRPYLSIAQKVFTITWFKANLRLPLSSVLYQAWLRLHSSSIRFDHLTQACYFSTVFCSFGFIIVSGTWNNRLKIIDEKVCFFLKEIYTFLFMSNLRNRIVFWYPLATSTPPRPFVFNLAVSDVTRSLLR